MNYVKLLRDGQAVWGVLQGDLVRTLTSPPFEALCYGGESLPLEACRLLAPCEATKIVCVGKNYYDHALEMGEGVPEQPILFLKAPCLNDVTARDVQKGDGQWTRGKSMDGFAPIGPVVTDEVDPSCLAIETRLNGAVVQQGNTSQFMTAVPQLLEFITASMTLEPGDVVTTGTPAGIGPMVPGDTVEVTVQGIGTLRNHIV